MKSGDVVKYRKTDEVGTIIGYKRMNTGRLEMLVKFDIKNEIWIDEIDLEKIDD